MAAETPIVFKSTHRIKFSELDPYNHVSTGNYATFFADHRMEGLRDYAGWDLEVLGTLPFMVWVRRMEIDYLRPARGDQEITITSFVAGVVRVGLQFVEVAHDAGPAPPIQV